MPVFEGAFQNIVAYQAGPGKYFYRIPLIFNSDIDVFYAAPQTEGPRDQQCPSDCSNPNGWWAQGAKTIGTIQSYSFLGLEFLNETDFNRPVWRSVLGAEFVPETQVTNEEFQDTGFVNSQVGTFTPGILQTGISGPPRTYIYYGAPSGTVVKEIPGEGDIFYSAVNREGITSLGVVCGTSYDGGYNGACPTSEQSFIPQSNAMDLLPETITIQGVEYIVEGVGRRGSDEGRLFSGILLLSGPKPIEWPTHFVSAPLVPTFDSETDRVPCDNPTIGGNFFDYVRVFYYSAEVAWGSPGYTVNLPCGFDSFDFTSELDGSFAPKSDVFTPSSPGSNGFWSRTRVVTTTDNVPKDRDEPEEWQNCQPINGQNAARGLSMIAALEETPVSAKGCHSLGYLVGDEPIGVTDRYYLAQSTYTISEAPDILLKHRASGREVRYTAAYFVDWYAGSTGSNVQIVYRRAEQ